MEKAQEAKEKTDISNEKEAIQLAVVNVMAKTNNISEIDENELENELSNSISNIIKDGDHWDVTGNTGAEYIIKDDGTVLSLDELDKELDSAIDIKFTKIEKYDNGGRLIYYYTLEILNENNITIQEHGALIYRDSEDNKELTLENAEKDSTITRARFQFMTGSYLTRDIGYGVQNRLYAIIKYGNHEFIKYGEQIHVYYKDYN